MKTQELTFSSGKIKYFNDGVVADEVYDFRSHIFQHTQSKFWSVAMECFAVHYDFLREKVSQVIKDKGEKEASAMVKKAKVKFAIKSVSNRRDSLVCYEDSTVYACFPDSSLDELEGLLRSASKDVSAINWFCYQCARRSFRQVVTDMKTVDDWVLQSSIDKVEREDVTLIINKQHIIHYPRPADQREKYLQENGIERLVLALA